MEIPLTLGHSADFRGRPPWPPLRHYLVNQHAAAGVSLLVRVADAEQGVGETWFESRLKRPDEGIAGRARRSGAG
jgi:hypothetical protein